MINDLNPLFIAEQIGLKGGGKTKAFVENLKEIKTNSKALIDYINDARFFPGSEEREQTLNNLLKLQNINREITTLKEKSKNNPELADINKDKISKLESSKEDIVNKIKEIDKDYQKKIDIEVEKDIEFAVKEGKTIGIKVNVFESAAEFAKKNR